MKHILASSIVVIASLVAQAQDVKLSGTIIGSEQSVDYTTGKPSTTVNRPAEAFDGDFNTCFAAYQRSFGWAGMELDQPYVITRVGFAARNDALGPDRMCLGVFQGANQPDFSDALPIYLIPGSGKIGEMTYADVNCSKGFKYVRYVGPNDARCNVAELEFYGIPGEGDDEALYQPTNLPLVVVNTPGMEWFNDDKNYEMNGSQIVIIKDGKVDVAAPGQIRGRGNASWGFPKKPFRIKFDSKQTVLGGPAKAKKWTMINNYGDKTLMRNKLAFDVSRMVGMEFTPVCHFVDCIFNGEYQGTYQLCDQIEVNKNRVNIKEMKATDTEGEALTGGYLVEIDAYASQEAADEWFEGAGPYRLPVTIKSPGPGVSQQYNYIRDKVTALEQAVKARDFADPVSGYRSLLDLDSFMKHLIVNEVSGNIDAYWSTYMTLDRGAERFVVGPVWDFDLGFDNDQRVWPVNNRSSLVTAIGSFAQGMKEFTNRIIYQDNTAWERLKYLWSYAREFQGVDEATLVALLDGYEEELQESAALNFKRWPILSTRVHQNPRAYGSFAAEVDNVRNYLKKRPAKLDQIIGRVDMSGLSPATVTDARVVTGDGCVNIMGCESFVVCDMQGMTIASGSGEARLVLPRGVYVVRVDGSAHKVVVR